AVAEDRDVRPVHAVVAGVEIAADGRRHAERTEVADRDTLAVESLRRSLAGHRRLPRFHHADRVEGVRAFDELAVVPEGDLEARAINHVIPDSDDAIGARIRERLEEDGIDGAEDRGARPDAERQRHDHERGEARVADEAADAIAQIEKEGRHAGMRYCPKS